MRKWDHEDLIFFELAVCGASWFLLFLGLITPDIAVRAPLTGFSLAANTFPVLAASILPAAYLVIISRQCRAIILRFKAQLYLYGAAVLIGFGLPFSGHLGFGDRYPLFGSETGATLIRVFLINVLLAPLWEEILWRGYFYMKISEMIPQRRAILVSALAWTIWHLGFLFFLYKHGLTGGVLLFLPIQYFAVGIILSCIFILGRETLYPCVVLHAGFNAAVTAYYGSHNRVLSVPAYAAETTMMVAIASALFFVINKKTTQIEKQGQPELRDYLLREK